MLKTFPLTSLFLNETQTPRWKLVLFSILAAASSVLLLAIINMAAGHASSGNIDLLAAAQFLLCLAIYFCSQKFVWTAATREVESMIESIRVRIFKKISNCELVHLETYGKGSLYSAVNQYTNTISVSANPIIFTIQSLVMLIFTLIYLATLSVQAFTLTVVLLICLGLFTKRKSKDIISLLKQAAKHEQHAFYALGNLLDGFKEVKLNEDRKSTLTSEMKSLAHKAKDHRINANLSMTSNFLGTQSAFYILLAVLVFCIPQLNVSAYPEMIEKIATVGLFLMGPITNIVGIMPTISNAGLALDSIYQVESALDSFQENISDTKLIDSFQKLEFHSISKSYERISNKPFKLGPLSESINKNDVIFITGGNGAGKSTFVKTLLGLYHPDEGHISFNEEKVDRTNLAAYRNLFSTVLTDYHLFPKAFSNSKIDDKTVTQYLDKMELTKIVTFKDNEFSTTKLSTGQRKRLALIISILEDKPILVFDEWAADQDPKFRRIFYTDIIPDLKSSGRTIIAVTHDDKYFSYADRHWRIENGYLSEIT